MHFDTISKINPPHYLQMFVHAEVMDSLCHVVGSAADVFIIVSTDVCLKRVTTCQEKQTLQLGAFPERPGDTQTPFNQGKFT